MSRSKRGGVVAAVLLVVLSLAAAAFAATITPKNGTFSGNAHYKVAGKAYKASLTVTVAKHKISQVQMKAAYPVPIDQKTSQNSGFCAAEVWNTKGEKRVGTIAKDGAFKYTFKSATATATDKSSDQLTLVGQFTNAKKAVGVVRDVYTYSSSTLNIKCDTGKLHFTVTHS